MHRASFHVRRRWLPPSLANPRDTDLDSVPLRPASKYQRLRLSCPELPGSAPRDIFDIPGSPSHTIFERTSRWRIRVDAAPPLQFRATMVLTPRLSKSEELCRLTRLLGSRAEQAVHRPDEPGVLPAPIERWRC